MIVHILIRRYLALCQRILCSYWRATKRPAGEQERAEFQAFGM